MKDLIKYQLPQFYEAELIDGLAEHGIERFFKGGDEIMSVGQTIRSVPLILSGSIKIFRQDEEGREVFLYYLEKGGTCAASLTCCMNKEQSSIRAVAETDVHLLMVPIECLELWTDSYKSWRNFIMQTFNRRFEDLLQSVDEIAFHSLDERLLSYLLKKHQVHGQEFIEITHQDIASGLNASRESISRMLKKLESLKVIELGRNKIRILKPELL